MGRAVLVLSVIGSHEASQSQRLSEEAGSEEEQKTTDQTKACLLLNIRALGYRHFCFSFQSLEAKDIFIDSTYFTEFSGNPRDKITAETMSYSPVLSSLSIWIYSTLSSLGKPERTSY